MLGNFMYCNPTRLYFGKDSLSFLGRELDGYGDTVMLSYGRGSAKRSGVYGQVRKILEGCGKRVVEDGGVMPNPTADRMREGARRARESGAGLILALGGGSVCDYAKAVSVSAHCGEDPWEKYFVRGEDVSCEIIPVGYVLTMTGTGSEMNGGSVITDTASRRKIGHVFGDNVFPKFSILNPLLTYTLPRYQMAAGIYDIMSHILEQYFSGEDDCTSDYIAEGLLRSLIRSARAAMRDPEDYEARSNIMWTASWALNTLLGMGKSEDWEVHMIGQSVGAYTDATHGMTLSAVSMAYYRHILPYGIKKFRRYAVNVWGVREDGRDDQDIAEEGLARMEAFMRELGLVMSLKELGVTEDMFGGIADGTFLLDGGYKTLTRDEVIGILKESM